MTTTRWHGGEREASGGAKARSSVVAVLLPIFIMSHSSVATNTLLKRTKGKREHAHKLKLQFILFLDKRMQHHKA